MPTGRPPRLHRLAALLLAIAATTGAPHATAAPERVLLMQPPSPDAAAREALVRLRAELRASGFEVHLVNPDEPMTSGDASAAPPLGEVAPPADAPPADASIAGASTAEASPGATHALPFAAIYLTPAATGLAAEIHFTDGRHPAARRVVPDSTLTAGGPGALAIRAAEILRARRLSFARLPRPAIPPPPLPSAPASGKPAPTAPASSTPAPGARPSSTPAPTALDPSAPAPGAPAPGALTRSTPAATAPSTPAATATLSSAPTSSAASCPPGTAPCVAPAPPLPLLASTEFEGALALLVSSGDFGAALGPAFRASYVALPVAIRVTWMSTTTPTVLTHPTGNTHLRQYHLGLDAARSLGPPDALFRPVIAAGVGIYHLTAEGHAVPPYQDDTAEAWTAALQLGAGLRAGIVPGAAVLLDVDALLLLPEPTIAFPDTASARAGLPLVRATLGLVVSGDPEAAFR
ncbi:hypothetical protein [Chondromyces apiculatus]|uniref:Uncharacterized protein n=1 Tax=Chondromyces apiculatus DSM 436 TaxID=1192034 RepID=A0A017TFP6_9BACT|nr:hypothetical protein [Chondromyces apiculatus]EYF07757.1 Hypothetical protein CAP_8258 [Chondromyces apiculatus DSM 436]